MPLRPVCLFGLVFGDFRFIVLTNHSNATADGTTYVLDS